MLYCNIIENDSICHITTSYLHGNCLNNSNHGFNLYNMLLNNIKIDTLNSYLCSEVMNNL